jgi:choline-sulfatase
MRWRVALLPLLLAFGCRRSPLGPYPAAPVVLISIDTLRADHLPAYGYRAGRTPNLDRLAREGILFEDVYSHCPLTLPAHSSLLTGLLPPHHGVRDNIGFTLKDTHKTLATRFKEAGLRTGGAVSAYVLRSQTGIAQGFDFYDDSLEIEASESLGMLQRDGAIATESLGQWIERQRGARLFAFLHLYEPHTPYTPPERYQDLKNPYDGEIAYADELVGRLLEKLRSVRALDRAILAVTSDHGEGLKDHGEAEHGVFLYREAVHVPLILRLPGGARGGERIAGIVSQADVAPTLLDLAALPAGGMDGTSLRPAIQEGAAEPRPAYSETLFPRYHFGWSELYAVTEPRYRFIRAPRPELYDVARDPGERTDVSAMHSEAVSSMTAWLLAQVDVSRVDASQKISPEVQEKLRALGYIGSGGTETVSGNLPDPKDTIGSYEDLKEAHALRASGKRAEAVALLQKILAQNPRMLDAWETLASTLGELGRKQDALRALVKALEVDPARAETNIALARAYALEGRYDLAIQHAEIASDKDPGAGFETLAQLMVDQGKLDRAGDFARRSLARDNDRSMSHYVVGLIAQRAGRYGDALAAFRRAEATNARRKDSVIRDLHYNIGDCLARMGQNAEAEREFQAEIKAIPRTLKGRVGLATLYRSEGRDEEARDVLGGLLSPDSKPTADAYWTVVQTLSVLGDRPTAALWAARARSAFPSDPRFR